MKHLATALLIAAATIAPATLASAASVAPIPVPPGSQSCDSIAARFGVQPGAWTEIRFTQPTAESLATGTHTRTADGNTVTLTIAAGGTVDFTSLEPIEAVYVNKGNGPNSANAIYRYVPPALSDTDLGLLPVVLSGVDHVVLCWTEAVAPTTTTPTTTPTTTTIVPATPPAAPTTPAMVRSLVVFRAPTRLAPVAQLPATGQTISTWVSLAALLALGGLVAVLATRRRQQPGGSRR